eukprot:jgi/Mesvir1/8718/Mv02648-RA.1
MDHDGRPRVDRRADSAAQTARDPPQPRDHCQQREQEGRHHGLPIKRINKVIAEAQAIKDLLTAAAIGRTDEETFAKTMEAGEEGLYHDYEIRNIRDARWSAENTMLIQVQWKGGDGKSWVEIDNFHPDCAVSFDRFVASRWKETVAKDTGYTIAKKGEVAEAWAERIAEAKGETSQAASSPRTPTLSTFDADPYLPALPPFTAYSLLDTVVDPSLNIDAAIIPMMQDALNAGAPSDEPVGMQAVPPPQDEMVGMQGSPLLCDEPVGTVGMSTLDQEVTGFQPDTI